MATLKEFSAKYLSAETEGYMAKWRRVFPLELREHNKFLRKRLFRDDKYHIVLEEKWERIHKGDVIDTEWRELPREDSEPWEY